MKKIKEYSFKILKTVAIFLRDSGLHKMIPYRRKLYAFLFKFWPGGNILEIQGSKMYISVNDKDSIMAGIFQSYALDKIHEKATTDLFKKIIKEGDTIVDLGANIGYFTLLAARLTGKNGKVYSFEPEPKNFSYLKKNIEINGYDNITIVQKAVSDKSGTTELFLCSYDAGHHTINQYEGVEAYSRGRYSEKRSIEIETITLDDFFRGKENDIDFIKIDVQGAEALALKGMDNILKTNNKLKIIVDFFPILLEKMGSSPEEFIRKLLENYNFLIYVIPEDNNAPKGEMINIGNVNDALKMRRKESDHINLFLKKRI